MKRPKPIIRDIFAFIPAPAPAQPLEKWDKQLLILLLTVFPIDLAINTILGAAMVHHNAANAVWLMTGGMSFWVRS